MSRFSIDINGSYMSTGENMAQISPGQMQHQHAHMMQNQMYNNSFRFAPIQNRANSPAHSMHM